MTFNPGDELYSLTIHYQDEDDDAINVDVHIRVNPECDPAIYARVFAESLNGIAERLLRAEQALIARNNAQLN
jgi:hypothetical protein